MMKTRTLDRELSRIVRSAQEAAGWLWNKGWAEKNAGNLSVNISTLKGTKFNFSKPFRIGRRFPSLGHQTLLVTAAGSRMRDLARDPMPCLGAVRVGAKGDTIQTAAFGRGRARFTPTSELPSHLAIQESFLARRSGRRAVLHTHPDELTALTHLAAGRDERGLNRILRAMHPEVEISLPRGAGLVPYMKPGSFELGRATVRALRDHDIVLWERHGCLAVGSDILEVFDLVDLLNKAARLFFLLRGTAGAGGGRS